MKIIALSFTLIVFSMIFFEAIWLSTMVKRFYTPQLGHILSDSFKMGPAIFFYLLFAIGLNTFVILPELRNPTTFGHLLILGMLFGAVTYGTYDLTNQATIKSWPTIVTVVDIAYGSVLSGAVTLIATYVTRHFETVA